MCIAYFQLGHPEWPLFIAANRDEFHQRPARPVAPWADHPDVLAGIDLTGGGTWLGVTRQGRFGLLTNYREPGVQQDNAPSRGELVSRWLTESAPLDEFVMALSQRASEYNGFNLVIGDLSQACYLGNRHPDPQPQYLKAGQYLVSNALLETVWPKTEKLRTAFENYIPAFTNQALQQAFDVLKDTTPAADETLPGTGLPLALERQLSSPFIMGTEYGTRCSTIIAVHASGKALVSEISYGPQGVRTQRHDWPFELKPIASLTPAP
ncbi:MAG TPA: NRDE family protein [Burkholderiaceae bacterium]|nr:NRDE family protein [Burkholderiaceae bacterium]